MAGHRQEDKVQGAVELGPETRALLRRILAALEQLCGGEVPDPGKDSEIDAEVIS